MILTPGHRYLCEKSGRYREIVHVNDETVTYRMQGVFTFLPMTVSVADFQRWVKYKLLPDGTIIDIPPRYYCALEDEGKMHCQDQDWRQEQCSQCFVADPKQ